MRFLRGSGDRAGKYTRRVVLGGWWNQMVVSPGLFSLLLGIGLLVGIVLALKWAKGQGLDRRNAQTLAVRIAGSELFSVAIAGGFAFGIGLIVSGLLRLV